VSDTALPALAVREIRDAKTEVVREILARAG